jgi:hypothetical protein
MKQLELCLDHFTQIKLADGTREWWLYYNFGRTVFAGIYNSYIAVPFPTLF